MWNTHSKSLVGWSNDCSQNKKNNSTPMVFYCDYSPEEQGNMSAIYGTNIYIHTHSEKQGRCISPKHKTRFPCPLGGRDLVWMRGKINIHNDTAQRRGYRWRLKFSLGYLWRYWYELLTGHRILTHSLCRATEMTKSHPRDYFRGPSRSFSSTDTRHETWWS